ncbi:hypothetical protein D9Q98_000180 [Chlorella vulgaris]|uniref:N-acylneuraminate-9-phosphatase n=1 Tax=Chlorella vulgaris TaxID=3077 RepID=A0A9D4TXV6_CHLVU|nr:hypothetical protein D9Q98_000180 [Chlorella vulgaris]
MRAVKAVFFDLDDTLVLTEDADKEAFCRVAALAEELLPPGTSGKQLIDDWRPLFHASPWCPEGKVEVEAWRAQLWLQAMARQGHEDAAAATLLQQCFSGTRLERYRFGPGVEEMVQLLHSCGLATAVITNGHRVVQRLKLEACGAARLFQHRMLVGGEEVAVGCGHEKPHPAIFHKACGLVGCLPEEALHVGDSLIADVGGALQAGLAGAIWINRGGARQLPEGMQAAAVLSSVLELPSALRELQVLPPE